MDLIFSYGDKQEDLFVMKTDGTGLRQLTNDSFFDRVPRWSPDGKRIAFFSNRSGRTEVWTINPDGSGLQQLTYASKSFVTTSVWSPDGARLAYSINADATYIMDMTKPWREQSPQALPPLSDPQNCFMAFSWSPDGQTLAGWQRRTDGRPNPGLTIYSLESQHYDKLTESGSFCRWLSDSRRLLFIDGSKLSLVDSHTMRVHEVLSVAPQFYGGLALSKDERLIYFGLLQLEADIWLMTLK